MIRTYREQKEYWEQSYASLTSEFRDYVARADENLAEIGSDLEAERKAWKNEVKRSMRPGFGAFVGAGYCSGGDIEAVVGVGWVWKMWQ